MFFMEPFASAIDAVPKTSIGKKHLLYKVLSSVFVFVFQTSTIVINTIDPNLYQIPYY